jgi:hypothetical protein
MSPGLRIFNACPTNWVVEAPIVAPMLIPDTVSNDGRGRSGHHRHRRRQRSPFVKRTRTAAISAFTIVITARFATRGTSKKTTLGGTYPQPGTIRLPMPWHRNWTPVADGNWGP